jgi:hypothetical protein
VGDHEGVCRWVCSQAGRLRVLHPAREAHTLDRTRRFSLIGTDGTIGASASGLHAAVSGRSTQSQSGRVIARVQTRSAPPGPDGPWSAS